MNIAQDFLWVAILRVLYSRVGIKRGLGGVMMRLARKLKHLQLLPVRMNDGRVLYLDLREPVTIPYLLFGTSYEAGETALVRSVIRPADVVWDIGANVGWYSTLLAEMVGPQGRVYAFEPNAKARRMLQAATSTGYRHVQVLRMALGDREGEAEIHIPRDLGNASLRDMADALRTERCQVTTADRFIRDEPSAYPVFIKCDAEGAERSILHGASKTISATRAPMWMIEMNPLAAARFGYHPECLTQMLLGSSRPTYRGYLIDEQNGELLPLPKQTSSLFNALFVPRWLEDRIATYRGQCQKGTRT